MLRLERKGGSPKTRKKPNGFAAYIGSISTDYKT